MVDLIHLGMFSIVLLSMLGFVSNTSSDAIDLIQGQMFLMNCPFPIYNGVATLVEIDGFALNYTVVYHNDIKTDFNGTAFECTYDPLSAPPHIGANTHIRQYGATTFWGTLPYGWLGYLSDSLGTFVNRTQALFTLISFYVTPSNFNILGMTLSNIPTIASLFIILIYAFCYITIGIMLYKVVSPFSGVG